MSKSVFLPGPSKYEKYDLNHKVDKFIEKYSEIADKRVMGTDIGLFRFPKDMRNYIESKASFAELKWPTQEIYYDKHQKNSSSLPSQERYKWEELGTPELNDVPVPPEIDEKEIDQQVMYRIIERGGNRVGARRGVEFAKDFGLDITTPVSYGIDYSDPHLEEFLYENFSQLDLDRICPVGYFSRSSESLDHVTEKTLREIMSKLNHRKPIKNRSKEKAV